MTRTSSPHPDAVPVLIAGAGPAGLTAAITLARLGVAVHLVERRPELSSLPRATTVSLRSMELLRSWGLEAAVLAGGVDVSWTGWTSPTLAAVADGEPWPTGIPSREQSAVMSPTAPACVPQDHLEPVLLDHLRTFPHARVDLHTEVAAIAPRAEGADVTLRDLATGAERRVRARYVIGADGSRSRVRAQLGIAMRGPDGLGQVVSALIHAPLWPVVGDRRHGIYTVTHPDGAGSFLPAGPGERWMYGAWLEPEVAEGLRPEQWIRRVRAGSGVPDLSVRVERSGSFSFAAQIADTFRAGDVFLTGDAAHRVTPRGGTGMNTAIRSAHDLAWKLGWVLNGWSGGCLLDSYEAERRPVAEHNVARSADPNGSVRETIDVLHVDLGGRLPHVWVAEGVSTLDLLGPGLTRFTGPRGAAPTSATGGARPPVTERRLDELTARALGIRPQDALLVRPDGVEVRPRPLAAVAA